MPTGSMNMLFFSSTSTPLYSTGWMPSVPGQYFGTCFFLVVLAIIFRALMAYKHKWEHRVMDKASNRRYVVVRGRPSIAERPQNGSSDAPIDSEESKGGTLVTAHGVEECVRIVKSHVRPVQPWRWRVDLPRAAIVTVVVGIGYLL